MARELEGKTFLIKWNLSKDGQEVQVSKAGARQRSAAFQVEEHASAFKEWPKENGNICFRNQGCKSRCCRKADDNCESHCTMLGSEGSKCQTQIFFGLYKECPCQSNLTCIFPKNQKTFKLIYGSCEKYVNQKTLEKTWF
uniref:colipase-like protein 1 n=1 Tax=Ictidomys tridecemlineatus TaxID=43179 RepID=UPI001A9FE341|nr:colipase-like protein 1 [Ictidomys tridecemlineatus]